MGTGHGHNPRDAGAPDPEHQGTRLAAGIAALSSFQQVTQQGDGKANMLLAVHVGLAAVLATQLQQLHALPTHSWLAAAFWAASAVYLTCFLVDGHLIVSAIRPRRADVTGNNAFALSAQLAAPASGADAQTYTDQIWQMAHAIADIAQRKNLILDRAITWTSAMVVSATVWLWVTAALT